MKFHLQKNLQKSLTSYH